VPTSTRYHLKKKSVSYSHYYGLSNYRDSGVEIWDSGDPIAEEYIRSCSLHSREISASQILQPYSSCLDYAHLGYVATRQNTQLLLNELCNRALSTNSNIF